MKVILFFSVAFIFCFSNGFLISKPGKDLESVTKEKFSNYIIARFKSGHYGSMKACSIQKKGRVLYRMASISSSPQSVESITKSISALVIGIAISRKDLKDVNQKILDFFPEYKNKLRKGWQCLTLEDLLTMSSGIEWAEDKHPEFLNPTYQMYAAENLYDYIFSRKISDKKQFNYASANAALLSEIIFRATGKSFAHYADDVLFKPLEITNYKWSNYKNGRTNTSGGLYLCLDDLAKLGMLYLQNGVWKGQQILQSNWINMSFKNYSRINDYLDINGYGYMWWINDCYKLNSGKKIKFFNACGFNNNHLILVPEFDLLIVTMGDCTSAPEKYLNLVKDVTEITGKDWGDTNL
ncbi:hypothetical protein CNR22_07800 [Sphingobacteriaceae bacterium]|nr:hypothetical protein CNR22_07800 [Sphingobacteriaceae bacterium]